MCYWKAVSKSKEEEVRAKRYRKGLESGATFCNQLHVWGESQPFDLNKLTFRQVVAVLQINIGSMLVGSCFGGGLLQACYGSANVSSRTLWRLLVSASEHRHTEEETPMRTALPPRCSFPGLPSCSRLS